MKTIYLLVRCIATLSCAWVGVSISTMIDSILISTLISIVTFTAGILTWNSKFIDEVENKVENEVDNNEENNEK